MFSNFINPKSSKNRGSFYIPKSAQKSIPIRRVYQDGLWELVDGTYSRTWTFTDINYAVAGPDVQKSLYQSWGNVLNSLPADVDTKITLVNRRLDWNDLKRSYFIPSKPDGMDKYRAEYNRMLRDKAESVNGIVQERYITVASHSRNVEEARSFFARVGSDLHSGMGELASSVRALDGGERLHVLHDFFRVGEEGRFHFDMRELARLGRDFKDLVCPYTIEFKSDHFLLNEQKVGRVLFMIDFTTVVEDTILGELSDLSKNLVISIDIQPMDVAKALRLLQRINMSVESDTTRWQRRQNENYNFSANVPYSLRLMHDEVEAYLNDLNLNDQKLMLVTFTLAHLADSMEELDGDTEALRAAATRYGELIPCTFQQEDGLNTVLPYGLRRLEAQRTMTTQSAAIMIPFSSQEIQDKNGGIFYGVNAVSGNMIICNRKLLQNGNGFIIGVSGSGKSFSAKEEMEAVILSLDEKDEIIVADPENEYQNLLAEMGGEIIHLAPGSTTFINAMDMREGYGDGSNPILLKTDFVLSLCEQIMGPGKLEAKGKSIIGRCMDAIYRSYLKDYSGTPPTLLDLYQALQAQEETEARDIALAMELFTKGSLNLFAHQTNVKMDSRILCFDILELGKQLKTVGMLVMLDCILQRVISNYHKGKRTWIYVDEAHIFFANEYSSNFLAECWKRYRKFGALATGITQNLEDCLRSPTARTMLSNSEFLLMLNQASTDRAQLAELLNISPAQMNYITNAESGRGLIKVGGSIVPFINEFPRDTELYRLMTTKPGERTVLEGR